MWRLIVQGVSSYLLPLQAIIKRTCNKKHSHVICYSKGDRMKFCVMLQNTEIVDAKQRHIQW